MLENISRVVNILLDLKYFLFPQVHSALNQMLTEQAPQCLFLAGTKAMLPPLSALNTTVVLPEVQNACAKLTERGAVTLLVVQQ